MLLLSAAGVHMIHGYGPVGFTVAEWLEKHSRRYPLTVEQALEEIVDPIRDLLVESASTGAFSAASNALYKRAFGVDVIALGQARIGAQMDLLVRAEAAIVFDSAAAQANLAALPPNKLPPQPCADAQVAAGAAPRPDGKEGGPPAADGGVPHYYVPKFAGFDRSAAKGKFFSANFDGHRVRLKGLKAAVLNGAEGTAGALDAETGRVPVRLTAPPEAVAAHPDGLKIKPENIEVLPWE